MVRTPAKDHLRAREGAVTGGETLGLWNQIEPGSKPASTSRELGALTSLSFGHLTR